MVNNQYTDTTGGDVIYMYHAWYGRYSDKSSLSKADSNYHHVQLDMHQSIMQSSPSCRYEWMFEQNKDNFTYLGHIRRGQEMFVTFEFGPD